MNQGEKIERRYASGAYRTAKSYNQKKVKNNARVSASKKAVAKAGSKSFFKSGFFSFVANKVKKIFKIFR